jgi:DNA-binding beta-propeller fold protein YncE
MAITPDGKTIYMPCGEERKDCNFWFVLNAATGKIKTKIPVYKNTHNTIVGLNGERVYMASLKYNYLSVADTKTNRVIQKIGPFGSSIRPFTINGAETLAFVNVDFLSGFEVGDITTGKKLYRVQVEGFPWEDPKLPLTQSHGVALTPDEKEVWVVDGHNHYLHVFDVTGLPNSAPKQVASIPLTDRPRWINVSRDGRFAHVSTGEIVSTKTRKTVAKVALSKHYLQIDFAGNVPVQAYSRYGVGYVTRSAL